MRRVPRRWGALLLRPLPQGLPPGLLHPAARGGATRRLGLPHVRHPGRGGAVPQQEGARLPDGRPRPQDLPPDPVRTQQPLARVGRLQAVPRPQLPGLPRGHQGAHRPGHHQGEAVLQLPRQTGNNTVLL